MQSEKKQKNITEAKVQQRGKWAKKKKQEVKNQIAITKHKGIKQKQNTSNKDTNTKTFLAAFLAAFSSAACCAWKSRIASSSAAADCVCA